MLCPVCFNPALCVGRNRKGRRRWHCPDCNRTFIGPRRRPKVGLAVTAMSRLWASLTAQTGDGR